mmetsp:Transcript_8266/g.15337  ORF Transcript_8266/g.15337 Transcript_8266/m.15337 type:complete len:262 (+) Transcript_8266:1055-1840(+)
MPFLMRSLSWRSLGHFWCFSRYLLISIHLFSLRKSLVFFLIFFLSRMVLRFMAAAMSPMSSCTLDFMSMCFCLSVFCMSGRASYGSTAAMMPSLPDTSRESSWPDTSRESHPEDELFFTSKPVLINVGSDPNHCSTRPFFWISDTLRVLPLAIASPSNPKLNEPLPESSLPDTDTACSAESAFDSPFLSVASLGSTVTVASYFFPTSTPVSPSGFEDPASISKQHFSRVSPVSWLMTLTLILCSKSLDRDTSAPMMRRDVM